MIHPLEILLPKDLKEALALIAGGNADTHIIAGGTDVVTGLGQGLNRFKNIKTLVDINKIESLKGIRSSDKFISIGAAETLTGILENPTVKKELPLLAKSCSTIGSVQIRNRATIAGNFVNNAPCADTVPVLLVYDARIVIESLNSKREIGLNEFLSAPYKTQLKKNEIVTSINIPVAPIKYAGDFYKLGRRRALAISRITLALLLTMNGKTINDIRIASGAVTPIGKRFYELEKSVIGKTADDSMLKQLSIDLGKSILDAAGLRWSSEYKLPVVQQVFYQMLNQIISGKGDK